MANLIQATVYQIDGAPLPSPITIDFQTSGILIKNASINIPSVNSAIQVYNNPNNLLWYKTYYVSETISNITSSANQGFISLTQATVLEINDDPQLPGGNQYSFCSQEIVIFESINNATGVNSSILFNGIKYSVSETQSTLLASSNTSSAVPITFNGIFPTNPYIYLRREPSFYVQSLDGTTYDFGTVVCALPSNLPTNGTLIDLGNVTGLTTLTFPATAATFTANNMLCVNSAFSVTGSTVTTINVPLLKFINNNLSFSSSSLTSINFPKLEYVVGSLTLTSWAAVTVFNLPELALMNGTISITGANTNVTTYNLPKLKNIYNTVAQTAINITNASVTTINLSLLENLYTVTNNAANVINIQGASLTTVNLSSIKNIVTVNSGSTNIINFTSSPNLTTLNIGTSLLRAETVNTSGVGLNVGNFILTSCSLNQTSVDNLLVELAKLDGTNGTTLLSNRTITITGTSSAPSATGIAAKSTLISRGCTVTTN